MPGQQTVVLGILLVGVMLVPPSASQAQFYGQNWYDYPDTTVYPGDPSLHRAIQEVVGDGLSDGELKEAVENQLFWSTFIDGDDIQVSVKNGKVTLRGTVEDQSTVEDAIENAYEAGARKVINKLKTDEKELFEERLP